MGALNHAASILAACALAAGCASAPTAPPTALDTLEVIGEVGANTDSATEIDVVFVYDSAVLALLPDKGPDWFERKQALRKGLARSIGVLELGVPPATVVRARLPDGYRKAIAVFGYANYLSPPGQARCNLTPYTSMVLWLTPDNVVCSGK